MVQASLHMLTGARNKRPLPVIRVQLPRPAIPVYERTQWGVGPQSPVRLVPSCCCCHATGSSEYATLNSRLDLRLKYVASYSLVRSLIPTSRLRETTCRKRAVLESLNRAGRVFTYWYGRLTYVCGAAATCTCISIALNCR